MSTPPDAPDDTDEATEPNPTENEMKTRTPARTADSPKRLRAAEVLGPRGVVQIEHEGEVYTLRLTRNNRLILTK